MLTIVFADGFDGRSFLMLHPVAELRAQGMPIRGADLRLKTRGE